MRVNLVPPPATLLLLLLLYIFILMSGHATFHLRTDSEARTRFEAYCNCSKAPGVNGKAFVSPTSHPAITPLTRSPAENLLNPTILWSERPEAQH